MKIQPWKAIDAILDFGKAAVGPATPLGLVFRGLDAVLPGDDDVKTQAVVEAAKLQTTDVSREGNASWKDVAKDTAFGFIANHKDEVQAFLDSIEAGADNVITKVDHPRLEGEDEIEADDALVALFDAYWNGLVERRVIAGIDQLKA